MKKNYLLLLFILFGIVANAQNSRTLKTENSKASSLFQKEKITALYTSEKLKISQEKIVVNDEKFLDVNFTNKTDKTILK